VPFSLQALQADRGPDGEDLILYDELGAGNGQRIGVSEGVEAAAPSIRKKPVDAYCAAILDTVVSAISYQYQPHIA